MQRPIVRQIHPVVDLSMVTAHVAVQGESPAAGRYHEILVEDIDQDCTGARHITISGNLRAVVDCLRFIGHEQRAARILEELELPIGFWAQIHGVA